MLVEQTGIEGVLISWNAPNTQASESSYHILINSTHNNATTALNATSSPLHVSLQPGVYSMQLVALSQTVIYELPSPVEFTVQGKYVTAIAIM